MYTHAQNLTPVASEDDLTVTEDGLSTADELDSGGEDEQLLGNGKVCILFLISVLWLSASSDK